MVEDWKFIPGYEGMYKVSSLGRILSCERIVRKNSGYRVVDERFRTHSYSRSGYASVTLFDGSSKSGKIFYVHRLVANAFVENPCSKPEVNHINGIKSDCRAENLEWVSKSENQIHALALGLKIPPRGEDTGRSILKESDVLKIRQMHRSGIPQKDIAIEFNVHASTISLICTRKIWTHI